MLNVRFTYRTCKSLSIDQVICAEQDYEHAHHCTDVVHVVRADWNRRWKAEEHVGHVNVDDRSDVTSPAPFS
jgi:hypothetical protein